MNASCTAFERWLDDGRPEAAAPALLAHADACARCSALLELELVLAQPPHAPGRENFGDAVMLRVREASALEAAAARERRLARLGALQVLGDPLLWLVVAGLAVVGVGHETLWKLGVAAERLGRNVTWRPPAWPQAPDFSALARTLDSAFANPAWQAALVLAITPVALLAGWWLYRSAERWTAGLPAVHVRRTQRMSAAAR